MTNRTPGPSAAGWRVPPLLGIGVVLLICLAGARAYVWYVRFMAELSLAQLCGVLGCVHDISHLPGGPGWIPDDSWGFMWMAHEVAERAGAERIYDLFLVEKQRFQYPPLLLLPFSILGPEDRFQTLFLLHWASLLLHPLIGAVAAICFLRLVEAGGGEQAAALLRRRRSLALLIALCFAAFPPVMAAAGLGQIQTLLTAMLMLAFLGFLLGRERVSAALVAGICACKPMLAPVLLWALIARRFRFAIAFAVAGAALGLASIALYGWQAHLRFLEVLAFLGSHAESFYKNSAPAGVVHRLLGHTQEWTPRAFAPYSPLVDLVGKASVAAFLAFGLLLARRAREDAPLSLAAAFGAFSLASPVVWDHHYSFFLPLVVVLMARLAAGPARVPLGYWLALWVGFAGFALQLDGVFRYAADPAWRLLGSALPYLGGVLLLGLAWRLLPAPRRAETRPAAGLPAMAGGRG